MMIFYDVLLIDDDPILKKPYCYRRKVLERLVTRITGRARLTTQKEIRFKSVEGLKQLRNTLALAFARQWEGIILKPLNDPYFRSGNVVSHEFASCWIKMKKDYIPGLGDAVDFAVLGAGYCTKEAAAKRISNLKWTHFYIGCLRNKTDVLCSNAKPHFTILDRVSQSLTPDDLISVNRLGQFRAINISSAEAHDAFGFDFQPGVSEMSVVFKEPFVFEILGAGFDRLPNQNLFTLRFPRVQKVHWDRDWKDAVGLEELQHLAVQARSVPAGDDLKEIEAWMKRLDQVDRGAKMAMLPWDDSQEHTASPQYRPKRSAKSDRRSRSAVSSPMVRVDSAEMTSFEYRLESGEVVEESDAPHRSTTRINEETGPLPSNSSSLLSSRPGNLKRLAISDEEDPLRALKKVKVEEDDRSSVEKSDVPPGMYQTIKTEPLSTVTNSARVRESPQTRSPSASPCSKPSGGETAVAIHDRVNGNLQNMLEPLSPEQQENAPSKNLRQAVQSAGPDSQPNKSPEPQPMPNNTNLLTPPTSSFQQHTSHDATSSSVQIPDLTTHKVILTPCVLQLPYSLVTTMLRPRGSTLQPPSVFWLPSSSSTTLLGPLLTPALSHNQPLLVLIDESHEDAMREVMKTLLAFMPMWNPARIEIWDWRFLRAGTGQGEGEGGWEGKGNGKGKGKDEEDQSLTSRGVQGPQGEKEKEKYFLANIVSVGGEGEGQVEIQWRGGDVTRMPSCA